MLNLAEELLLLALNDEKGTVVTSASLALPYGLAGAILMELTLDGHLDERDGRIVVTDTRPTKDGLLNDALQLIRDSEKRRKPDYWVDKIARIKNLKGRVLDRLIDQGVLKKEEHKILWVFPSSRYPEKDPGPERDARHRVRAAVLEGADCDARTSMLIVLIQACELVHEVFDKSERKTASKRIKEISEGEDIGKAVSNHVAAIQAAIAASVTASFVATSVVTTS